MNNIISIVIRKLYTKCG